MIHHQIVIILLKQVLQKIQKNQLKNHLKNFFIINFLDYLVLKNQKCNYKNAICALNDDKIILGGGNKKKIELK